jgi:hypothetical protein
MLTTVFPTKSLSFISSLQSAGQIARPLHLDSQLRLPVQAIAYDTGADDSAKLASDAARFFTGVALPVDGRFLASGVNQ